MEITIVSADGSRWTGNTFVEDSAGPPLYKGWRCLHQAEGGYPNPDHMPIVRPSLNIGSVPFDRPMQLVSFKINNYNVNYTGSKWRSTYNGGIAFTNNNGYDDPDAGPRADFVNRRDMTSPLPKLMKGIICGGSFYTGTPTSSITYGISNFFSNFKQFAASRSKGLIASVKSSLTEVASTNVLVMTPGVDAIDASKPMSDIVAWSKIIMEKVWYFTATTRAGDKINNFPQGVGKPVYISFFLNKPAMYPLKWFTRWESSSLPNPLIIYKPL